MVQAVSVVSFTHVRLPDDDALVLEAHVLVYLLALRRRQCRMHRGVLR
jgi:hypothetical protein